MTNRLISQEDLIAGSNISITRKRSQVTINAGYSSSSTTILLSQTGIDMDCNIYTGEKIGGGTPTDNTARINAILDDASATHPIELIVDGGCAVKTLIIPDTGYVTIRGLGHNTGFFLLNGTDGEFIRTTTHPWTPGAPEAIAGYNVMFKDFYLNGNRHGNSTTGDERGPADVSSFYTCFHIHAIQNLVFDNVFVCDSPAYALNLYGCERVRINGLFIESVGRDTNTDGIHLNGGCHDVIINNCYFATGDDAIAINCDEGDAESSTDIIVSNIVCDDCYGFMRIYGRQTETRRIIISNVTGTVRSYKVVYGLETDSAPSPTANCNHSVTFSNIDLAWSEAITPTGDIILSGSGGRLILNNWQHNSPKYVVPILYGVAIAFAGCTISSIEINGGGIYRDSAGSEAASLAYIPSGTIKNLSVNGFKVRSQGDYGDIGTLISVQDAGVVSRLFYRNLDLEDVAAIYGTSGGGTITSVNSGTHLKTFIKDTSDASTDTGYTGVGFQPSVLHVIMATSTTLETSDGFDDGTNHWCRTYEPTTGKWLMDNGHCGVLYQTSEIFLTCDVQSLDKDGYTLLWTKTGSKTGTATIIVMAIE